MDEPEKLFFEQISMRPVVMPDDETFLKELYITTRDEDMAMWGLPEEQGRSLAEMQYRAQKMQYEAEYTDARHEVILFNEIPAGRLMSTRNEAEVLAIDIAVLPEYRSMGIGTVVLKGLMREAEESEKPFNLSVVKNNHKAMKLYQRLGFDFTGETVSHYLLQWRPKQA